MEQEKNSTKKRGWEQISYRKRVQIEIMLKKGCGTNEIAEELGYSRRTIEREKKRGLVKTLRTKYDEYAAITPTEREYETVREYSAEAAEKAHKEAGQSKGKQLKLGKSHDFAEYIEEQIGKKRLSPYAALAQAKLDNKPFAGLVCVKTLYSYIDANLFLKISNKDLWVKKEGRKREYRQVRPAYNNKSGRSIEERPKELEKRLEPGHWEMDTVVGKGRMCLLVFTERVYRREIILKLKSRSQSDVIKALDKLERRWGAKKFRQTFKSLTSDNGGEFLSQEGIERSSLNIKRKRTTVYYCHPYSAYERGSNENANKLIRRFIPKGASISDYSEAEIRRIEHYINNYPRKLLGGYPPNSLYQLPA